MDKKNKTKVLVFSLSYFPFIGGAEIALHQITTRLKHIQFDLITAKLSQDLSNSEIIGNLHIWRVGKGNKLDKYLYPLRAFLFSRKLYKKNKYNLIWAMMASWAGIAALFFKTFKPKVKYLLTLQSGDSNLFIWSRTWFWYPIYRLIYTRADHIQVISSWLKKRARNYGYKGEITILPNGVDLAKMQNPANQDSVSLVRSELKIPANHKIVFTSSRLVKKNDIQTLIKSIQLLDQLPVTLIIAGMGDLESKLKDLAKQLNLDQQVIFLGQLEPDDLIKYYSAADVFVRPSLSEGQGNSFIEAMAAGLPVIGTPVGGILDFLLDKKTGLFCKVKDPDDLAEKIKLLLTNQELYAEIQKNGLALVKQKYDWDLTARQMKNIFLKYSS